MEADAFAQQFTEAIGSIPDPWKARILSMLDMSDEDRAAAIGALFQDGRLPNVAEMLMDLEEAPTAAAIGGDGTIYFGSGDHDPAALLAVNPDGTLKWQYMDPVGGYVRTPPVIGKGQRIYAGGLGDFFAIGP